MSSPPGTARGPWELPSAARAACHIARPATSVTLAAAAPDSRTAEAVTNGPAVAARISAGRSGRRTSDVGAGPFRYGTRVPSAAKMALGSSGFSFVMAPSGTTPMGSLDHPGGPVACRGRREDDLPSRGQGGQAPGPAGPWAPPEPARRAKVASESDS